MRNTHQLFLVKGWPILTSLQPQAQIPEPSISEIREELRSVLASPRFRQSPRMVKLLRYLCSCALADEAERITEYTIALDVLGKTEDFKEGKDAIVRVEVHRLRKRLAEFYAEEGALHRVRIVIPTGNYAPQFYFSDAPPGDYAARHNQNGNSCSGLDAELVPGEAVPAGRISRWRAVAGRRSVTVVGLLSVIALLPAYRLLNTSEQPLDEFWNPVLASSNVVLLCIGNQAGGHSHAGPENADGAPLTLKEFHSAQNEMVHVADATTLARFASLIESKGKRYRIVSQSEATYADLQGSPAVLIGLLNNDWTKRLVGELRFNVERPGPGKVLIRDRKNPLNNDWFIDYYVPYMEVTRDYALVLRATDPKTEQMTVTAAGMSVFGTLAAGEFLTDSREIRKLAEAAPKGWKRKNLEVVLSTQVIRGTPGPPTVVATHFW